MLCSIHQSTHNSNNGHTTINPSDEPQLLPGLPNHLAQIILSTVRPSLLSAVCRQWRHLIYTPYFPPFLSLYTIVATNNNDINFFSFDPISSKWTLLPYPKFDPPIRFIHRHPSFISRKLDIQSLTVDAFLVLIAATDHNFLPALSHPLIFDPSTRNWFRGPQMTNPRRWCAAGCVNDTVYVASGVGAHYRGDVAKMVEKWDVKRTRHCNMLANCRDYSWRWEKLAGLKDGQFSREAVDAVGYKGKICMVNVKGNAAKEGAVYDIKENRWEKMAVGMVSGWNGVVGVVEDVMYVVDEKNGGVRKYDDEHDCWEEVIKGSKYLKEAEHLAVGGGKICVVSGGGRRITVVDVVAEPVRIWVVDPPLPECEVISVHILDRPCNI
ncbi:F-box/kelch-repeat protein SKIP25-like [Rutidosis leptorrhynchoides]|uniref:F-box/kelch-repeat protein SKIP25-like n=1 Tax=Rutidosis leptorrhynchoides TaxID=125765 RepID=UPI003A9A3346